MNLPIAVQLYTLREYTKTDFIGTLEKVAALGYKGVEFAGFGELDAVKIKDTLECLNLKAAGSHVMMDDLEKNYEAIVNFHHAIGCDYIVIPWFKADDEQEYVELGKKLDVLGAKLREEGITLCYHNHAHEFEVMEDKYLLDHIFDNTLPDNLSAEMDTYWTEKGGVDTLAYLTKFKNRLPLVHIKDMDKQTGGFAEIGEGILNITAIAEEAEELGAKWLIVEQDVCNRPAMESVAISIDNLKRMGLA